LYSKFRRSFLLKPEITQKVIKLVQALNDRQDVQTVGSSVTIPERSSCWAKIASLVGNHRSRTSAVMLGLAVSMGISSFPTNYLDTAAVAESAPTAATSNSGDRRLNSIANKDFYADRLRTDVSVMQAKYAPQQPSILIAQAVPAHPRSVANRTDPNNLQFSGEASVPIEVGPPKTRIFKPVATVQPYYTPNTTPSEGELYHPNDGYPTNRTGETSIGFNWPAAGTLTSRFGRRWGRMHKGIDIAGPTGTPINAAADGTVIAAGWSSGGYGNLVEIRHSDGTTTRYGHNSRLSVSVGQIVRQGQQVAEMGSTGHSTGSHLHFEIRPSGGDAVNPIAHLPTNS
jgi:murein DD-endopeptidase MepM/ murein hydrolase activator NlpD